MLLLLLLCDIFAGDFFFFLVTWVHSSSSLLGRSPVSALGLPLVGGIMSVVAIVVVVVVVVVVVIDGDDVGSVVF